MNQMCLQMFAQSKRSKIYTESDRSARSVLVGFKENGELTRVFEKRLLGWHLEAICVAV